MEASTLKVMSINIRYDTPRDGEHSWNARKDAVIQIIRDENPDVFGIQEGLIHQVRYIEEHFPGHERIGVGRDDGNEAGEHAAMFCKKERVRIETSGTFWLSDTPGIPGSNTWNTGCRRVCTWCLATDINEASDHQERKGRPMLLMNTHLDNASLLAREKGASLIVDKMAELHPAGPCIVMGDLNTRKYNERTVDIIAHGKACGKLTRAGRAPARSGKTGCIGFTWHDFRGVDARWYHRRGFYDYIFFTNEFQQVEYKIVTRKVRSMYPSDHFPVVAKFTRETRQGIPIHSSVT